MYKLLHFLFGWDYISWKNSADSGIARIHVNPDGIPYYWRYKNIDVLDPIPNPGTRLIFLTCKEEKYIKC